MNLLDRAIKYLDRLALELDTKYSGKAKDTSITILPKKKRILKKLLKYDRELLSLDQLKNAN